jgi:hypothetical protein
MPKGSGAAWFFDLRCCQSVGTDRLIVVGHLVAAVRERPSRSSGIWRKLNGWKLKRSAGAGEAPEVRGRRPTADHRRDQSRVSAHESDAGEAPVRA